MGILSSFWRRADVGQSPDAVAQRERYSQVCTSRLHSPSPEQQPCSPSPAWPAGHLHRPPSYTVSIVPERRDASPPGPHPLKAPPTRTAQAPGSLPRLSLGSVHTGRGLVCGSVGPALPRGSLRPDCAGNRMNQAKIDPGPGPLGTLPSPYLGWCCHPAKLSVIPAGLLRAPQRETEERSCSASLRSLGPF